MKPLQLLIGLLLFLAFNCKTQKPTTDSNLVFRDLINPKDYPNIDGIIVAHNNEIIIEEYFNGFDKDQLHQTRSSFKSITSILAGIAIDQGLFSVEDEIDKFITEWKNDPRGKIKVKDLLEMRSGLACENFFDVGPDCESEMYDTDDWLGYILNIPLRYEPGQQWEYSSMEPDLAGIIISRSSNMTLMDFADQYLFSPLGIETCEWEITPDGRGYAAGSSSMKPIDMLKIAALIANKGHWNGTQVVSESWINESTNCTIHVDMSFLYWSGMKNVDSASARYGYLWYRELLSYQDIKTDVLFASGNGGQYMMILEDYDAVVAFTGSNYGNWKGKLPFKILLKHIIPILEDNE
ncbi:MAG: serine hydrolase domain-containing protein [Bacteroidota bacterium]